MTIAFQTIVLHIASNPFLSFPRKRESRKHLPLDSRASGNDNGKKCGLKRKKLTCLATAFLFASTQLAHAASYIRDAEVEHTLRQMTTPILRSAGITPDSVQLFVINDPSINAFVAGGLNIFVHTGLILQADTPDMLLGVLAHETGHIAGGHLTQLSSASQQASMGALLSYALGAAAIIAGSGQAGAAVMSAGQNTAMRNLLSHYRGNEQQADQAAIRYLRDNHISPKGMLDMFELLRRKEKQHQGASADPYLRTHPLTTERIAAMRSAVSSATTAKQSTTYQTAHKRMVAKLYAFLETPAKTFDRYPDTDKTQAGHLARSVAWLKTPNKANALKEVDALIALSPDAFSYDLKGQILFEFGEIKQALRAYQTAQQKTPNNGLILTDLGKSYLAAGQLTQATDSLQRATHADPSHATAFHHLAIAYGKQKRLSESYLALARETALKADPEQTLYYAKLCQKQPNTPPNIALQADDLIVEATRLLKEQKNGVLTPF